MAAYQETLTVRTTGAGMADITGLIASVLARSGMEQGVVTVFAGTPVQVC